MPHRLSQLINLEKPLVVFDLETSGLAISIDKIIEVAYIKVMPNGVVFRDDIFLNPEMTVPTEAVAIHGLTDEFLADKPTFAEKAQELWEIFDNCHYGGYNIINFDLPILRREFIGVGMDFDYSQAKIVDSKTVYQFMEPRTLSAAYQFYCAKEYQHAHQALADVEATAEILVKQLEKYDEIRDWDFIYKIHHWPDDRYVDNERKFYWRNGEAYFSFSKYRDQPLAKVVENAPEFLNWILSADFSEETKAIVKNALAGEFPKKAEQKNQKS